jgi:rod shape determining protein RodA
VLGILSIYSSTYQIDKPGWQLVFKRQIIWAVLGLIIFLVMANFNYHRLWDITYFLYLLAVGLLLLVFILGTVRLGAQRWLKIAWLNFQPSELAKLSTVILLARYFSSKSVDDVSLRASNFGLFRSLIVPFCMVMIPVGLIVEQPDLGSATMLTIIFITMVFLAGVRWRYLLLVGGLVAVAVPFAWQMLRGYQRDRLMVFLNPNIDPLGAGYTIIQSKIAVGSAGFFGKGWLSGTQSQLHFLPESHTDFIFATFTEEWGFLGALALLLLYFLLIRQGLMIAVRTRDYFGRLLALGIAFMFGLQTLINIAMTIGLAPVVGIPLPLMSYGGSSIFISFAALGILANIDIARQVF